MKLLVINGPNLNLLGVREPSLYGTRTYADLLAFIASHAEKRGIVCDVMQSNHEGVLIDAVQGALGVYDGIVINAAAYTHTSIALADALKAVALPAVEVHLTDVSKRETYRRVSYLRDACRAVFAGDDFDSYAHAIDFLCDAATEEHA